MMNSPRQSIETLHQQSARIVQLYRLLHEDSILLLRLLARLASANRSEFSAITDNLDKLQAPVADFFELDKNNRQALEKMVQLTFVGRLFQSNSSADDPYAFEQLEWLLRESESLSVLATAMRLSLERCDGRGAFGMDVCFIPLLSTAYRSLLESAEAMLAAREGSAVASQLTQRLNHYLEAGRIQKLVKAVLCDRSESPVEWINPMQLRPRMTVLEDVVNPEGLLLIAKHTCMTESMISSLLNYDCMRGITHSIPVQIAGKKKRARS